MEVNNQDVWVMLLATVRYAMGRRSYMPSLTVDFFHRYRKALTQQQQDQLVEEIANELTRYEAQGQFMGDKVDHETWSKFVSAYSDERYGPCQSILDGGSNG